MDPERWKRVDDLLQSALARPESEREAFLHQTCAGDDALEREVRSLLTAHEEAGSFLESPAMEVAARALSLKQGQDTTKRIESLIGRTVSHYRIVERLGGGGMGWCTRPRTLDCNVSWLSSFFLMKWLAIPRLLAASSARGGLLLP